MAASLLGELALLAAGALMGNAICRFDSIAAASVAGIKYNYAMPNKNLMVRMLKMLMSSEMGLLGLLVRG